MGKVLRGGEQAERGLGLRWEFGVGTRNMEHSFWLGNHLGCPGKRGQLEKRKNLAMESLLSSDQTKNYLHCEK